MIRIRFKVKVRVGMVLGLGCGLLHQYSGGVFLWDSNCLIINCSCL